MTYRFIRFHYKYINTNTLIFKFEKVVEIVIVKVINFYNENNIIKLNKTNIMSMHKKKATDK